MLQESFDPIRIKLRVIPISKAPEPKGMNSDYYFIMAGKQAMQGELPHAIDLLKRGLLQTPTHYLCRFMHAVILFKFGLIAESAQDFHTLTITNPKEFLPHFNLSICLLQMGLPQQD